MVPASGGLGEDHAFSRHGPILLSRSILSRVFPEVPYRTRARYTANIKSFLALDTFGERSSVPKEATKGAAWRKTRVSMNGCTDRSAEGATTTNLLSC